MTLPFCAGRANSSAAKLALLALAIALCAPGAVAQTENPDAKPGDSNPTELKPVDARYGPETCETIYLTNATSLQAEQDLTTALRNMLSRAKIYYVSTQNALTIRANAEDMQVAHRLISELDRARKAYRVTYTLTERDSGGHTATSHVSMVVAEGGKSELKQGNKVPLVTGSTTDKGTAQQQVQYIDVGLNISASIDGEWLRTKVERSGVSDEKSGLGAQDPVVSQTTLEGQANVSNAKPVALGSIDIPGTTRHEEIEVTTELLH